MAKWLMSSNKRFFTLDFDNQVFRWSSGAEADWKDSKEIDVSDITGVQQLGPRSLGFLVNTRKRDMRLFAKTCIEAKQWIDALKDALDVMRHKQGLYKHWCAHEAYAFQAQEISHIRG